MRHLIDDEQFQRYMDGDEDFWSTKHSKEEEWEFRERKIEYEEEKEREEIRRSDEFDRWMMDYMYPNRDKDEDPYDSYDGDDDSFCP